MKEYQTSTEPPEPDAASELVCILAEAFISVAPATLAAAFVRELAERLKQYEEEAEVVVLSPRAPAHVRARAKAFAILRRELPDCVRRLKRE